MRRFVFIGFLILLLLVSACLSVFLGAAETSPAEVWNASVISIQQKLHLNPTITPDEERLVTIIGEIRLPRVLLACVVGAMLAIAGVAFQGLLRNPLADPYIVGVSSGAAVGGAASALMGISGAFYGFASSGIALLCALLGMGLVYAAARRNGEVHVGSFLLAGVAIGSAMWAIITLLLVAARQDLNSILGWLMGSFADKGWGHLGVAFILGLIGWVFLQLQSRDLNVFSLGEETAKHLGIDIEKLKRTTLLAGSIITAGAVSVCGIIGFVGLMVPHIARRTFGPDHRLLYPVSGLMGAILMIWADAVARMLLAPTEIPVGVVTALLGTPFFVYLLRKTV